MKNKKNKENLSGEIQRLFREKRKRRTRLAHLPFEKKILILLELQKIASGVGRLRERGIRLVWQIDPST